MTTEGKSRVVVVAISAAVAVVMLSLALASYYYWWVPIKHLSDCDWCTRATDAEQLEAAHRVLTCPFTGHHDASIIVCSLGGPESVPYLLVALKWQPETEPGGVMECTKSHCLEALRRITGHDAGHNYADWAAWWESVGHKIPPTPAPADPP